ncbi:MULTISPECIES: abortive infection family protein [Burkholderia cepacia complex]|uniref:abortive infection family protein n=1 Tax=Burkholderia cepacia complex TaxID=87882 RepID=UPI001B9122FD|nr:MULTISPECIES: abortive infection family protein [Burkholderia cepacia complex]MBR8480796.1 abortive infection family protein [Burkholderia cenocepacia]MCA7983692.1 abortive infection family protein [Burkholderia vietnamiensis]
MKISDYSVQKIGEFIAGDPEGWPYRRGVDLVDFFNKQGFRDVYGEGFPTRRVFAQERLAQLNGKPKLKDTIREMLDPRLWIDLAKNGSTVEAAAEQVNEILNYDGYEVVRDGNLYKVRELSGAVIEVENRFDQSSELSELIIEEQIQKCREKIESGDYSGAITNARTLIEAVLLKIESELDPSPQGNDGDLVKLFQRVRKHLNLEPSRQDISDALKQVLSGLASIVLGLATMRNKMSDAHGVPYKPSRHHAKLAVNAAKTLADFLFDTMSYQKEKGTIKKA